MARLKALAAHHAITTFDLSDTFDHDDPATLEIAAWDDHPNATGHQRLFEALARAIAADPTLSPLLFRREPSSSDADRGCRNRHQAVTVGRDRPAFAVARGSRPPAGPKACHRRLTTDPAGPDLIDDRTESRR